MAKEIPILFSTPMVQAILAGRKTQTRRIVKFPMKSPTHHISHGDSETPPIVSWAKWQPEDVLYVRETWRGVPQDVGPDRIEYKATEMINLTDKWRPSLFMPKEAARIWLEVESVRVERLQEISEEDALAEGLHERKLRDGNYYHWDSSVPGHKWYLFGSDCVAALWKTINGPKSWEQNPWVWVVSFKVLSTTGRPK